MTVNSFFVHFMMAAFASSIGILLILSVKKGFKKHISTKWQCKLNLLFFILLAVPFIPGSFFSSINRGSFLRFDGEPAANAAAAASEGTGIVHSVGWLYDFAVPVNAPTSEYLSVVFIGIWIIGIIAFTVIMLLCNRNLFLIKESVKPVEDEELLALFSHCKMGMDVKTNIMLGSSILVKTPMTIGFFKTLIILPAGKISLNDARYAMLHELTHCKNKDIQINAIMCLFQILYWFNPLVYFIFRQMRLDRELACDASILEMLPKELHINYGETLLNFANKLSRPSVLFLAAEIGGSKPQIIKRIRYIISYTSDTNLLKAKSVCIFALMGLLVLFQIPFISALAGSNDSTFNFQAENVQYQDLTPFFNGFEGSFVLYDLNNSMYTVHNRNLSVTRVSPNSTYKIYSALIALEQGILEANNSLREWDNTIQPFEAWNQDHNLTSAMRYSVNWYFQYFDAQVGIDTLYYYLTHLSYGNRNLSGGITDFWIESSLRISPLEQVSLLRDFYLNNTIFETRHVDTLKDVLRLSENGSAVLSGKTGTGLVSGRAPNGWFIGYVETGGRSAASGNTYFFAAYIQGEDNAWGSTAAQIVLSILEDKGIYFGEDTA